MLKRLSLLGLILASNTALAADSEQDLQIKIQLLEEKVARLERLVTTSMSSNKLIVADKVSKVKSTSTEEVDKTVKFGGKIDIDVGALTHDKVRDHGATIRKARINAKGKIDKDWKYKIEVDFAKSKSKLKKAYVEYKGFDKTSLKLGRNYFQFGLDREDKFAESHLASALIPGVEDGAQLSTYGDGWTFHTGIGLNDATQNPDKDEEASALFGRATYAPIHEHEGDEVLQFGVSSAFLKPRTLGYAIAYTVQPETKFASNALDSGEIKSIKHIKMYGGDIVYKNGPFSLQTEFITNRINRAVTQENLKFSGGYVQATWMLTGESREYFKETGSLGHPIPNKPFRKGEDGYIGAWELAARYSTLSLNSGGFKKGKMDSYTVGLNWYINKNIHTMFNYIMAKTDKYSVTPNNNPRIFLIRTHIEF